MDTTQLRLLNLISERSLKSNHDKSTAYAEKTIKLANLLLTGQGIENKNQSAVVIHKAKKGLGNAYYNLANINARKDNYETALDYYNKSFTVFKEIEDLKGISYVYNGIGNLKGHQGKYSEAIKMLSKSLEIKKQLGDVKGTANSYGNLGMIYEDQANYAQALKMQFKSLSIKTEINDTEGMASTYMNIAKIYSKQLNYSEALKMELPAVRLMEKTDNKLGTLRAYNDLGVIYKNLDSLDEALKIYTKALKIAEEIGNKSGIGGLHVNLGIIELRKHNFLKAEDYFIKSLKITNEINFKAGILAGKAGLGDLYLQQKMYAPALKLFNEALNLAKETGNKNAHKECLAFVSETYEATGNYKMAYEFHKLYSAVNDSINNERNTRQINELKLGFENERKEQEIELLNRDKKNSQTQFEEKLKHQTLIKNVFIAGFVFICLLILILIINHRQKIKSNNVIAQKNQEINVQKANLKGQEEERKRIARELHDGVGGSLAAIRMNLIQIQSKNESATDLPPVINSVGNACKEIRSISHNLAAPLVGEIGFVELIESVIGKFDTHGKTNINFEYFEKEKLNIIPPAIQSEVYRIIQELLNNVIKHSAATVVDIDLSLQENNLYVLVEDNGIGFDLTESKKGIGLENIRSRINSLRGELIIDSVKNRGTAFNITLPIIT